MLVIGPFLSVRRYVWSFSRSRQPLLRPWQFRLTKLATHPLPLSTRGYRAVHMFLCPGRWDIWVPPRPPEAVSTHLSMHTYAHLLLEDVGNTVNGEARAKLQTVGHLAQRMVKPVDFERLRQALELLMQYWFSVVTLPARRAP
jgi:hypothetical protein